MTQSKNVSSLRLVFLLSLLGLVTPSIIPKEDCENVTGVEIRYNEFFELYLGHNKDTGQLEETGIVYRSLKSALNACCPGMPLNFTKEEGLVEELLQDNILNHHDEVNNSNLVFYFPEFSKTGQTELFSEHLPFLKLRKSPGFALVMFKSDSHLNVSPHDILVPSWPILALIISLSWVIGILGWALDNFHNPEDFPKPFIRGMFAGFWWAIVTMSTVGYGDKIPKTFPARCLAVLWILAGAILLSLFTANATSIITASRIEKNEQTMGKKIGVVNMINFVETELNLGANLIDYKDVNTALDALHYKEVDRLLFPHYLDLLYIMSNKEHSESRLLSDLFIAKVYDTPFQIGMVLSHGKPKDMVDAHFYTCVDIMTSRFARQFDYDYTEIDVSSANFISDTFDTTVTTKILYVILGIIAAMVAVGLLFDLFIVLRKKRLKSDSATITQQNGVV